MKPLRFITRTALLLALLITMQALTKGFGQFVTGSWVNAILAVSVLLCGLGSGLTVAVLSPVLAFLLGIAPLAAAVPAIMVGNCLYVTVLYLLRTKLLLAWPVAALVKFGAMYLLVCRLIVQLILPGAPQAAKLLTMFSWPQLVTALIGGAAALVVLPLLRKAAAP